MAALRSCVRDRLFLEEQHADLVVEIAPSDRPDPDTPFRQGLLIRRNIGDLVGGAELIVVRIDDRLLVDDVDLALEMIFLAERNQNRPGVGAELLAHAVDRRVEVGADAVHLVDERDARHAVFGGLPPDGFRLGLHAGNAAKDGDRAIEHAQRALDLGREIHVAGSVDDVDALLHRLQTSCRHPPPCAASTSRSWRPR